MCANEDVIIRAYNCKTFSPFLYFIFILFRNKLANLAKVDCLLKGVFVYHNQTIVFFIIHDSSILKAFNFLE
jgi:hypothetical protein